MVLTLGLITLVAAFALGYVYDWTKEPIAQAQIDKQNKAIRSVAGEFENDPLKESFEVHRRREGKHRFQRRRRMGKMKETKAKDEVVLNFYPTRQDDKPNVTAIKSYSDKGYSGRIELMVGIDTEGKIKNIEVLNHKETPGLGSKIKDQSFISQFIGQSLDSFDFRPKKDGGQVDAISGATISSRAFAEAVKLSLEAYNDTKHETDSL